MAITATSAAINGNGKRRRVSAAFWPMEEIENSFIYVKFVLKARSVHRPKCCIIFVTPKYADSSNVPRFCLLSYKRKDREQKNGSAAMTNPLIFSSAYGTNLQTFPWSVILVKTKRSAGRPINYRVSSASLPSSQRREQFLRLLNDELTGAIERGKKSLPRP